MPEQEDVPTLVGNLLPLVKEQGKGKEQDKGGEQNKEKNSEKKEQTDFGEKQEDEEVYLDYINSDFD